MRRLRLMVFATIALAVSAAPAFSEVLIWEVDYDQPGPDTAEWIELHNPSAAPFALTGLDLVLRNGTLSGSCAEYCRIELDAPEIPEIPAGGYIVLGEHPCAVAPLCAPTDAIQNGAPDAVAIEDRTTGSVIDSVEYEFTGSSACGLSGTSAADDPNSDPQGSIQFCAGEGWFYATSTPCAANDCPVASQESSWSGVKTHF